MIGELRISNHFFYPYPSIAVEVFCGSRQLIRLPDASRIHLNRNPDVVEGQADGVVPAVINAIYDATGVRLHQIPATPERVWRALKEKD